MTDIQQAAKKMRLGDALIAEGLINEEQLQQALAASLQSLAPSSVRSQQRPEQAAVDDHDDDDEQLRQVSLI